MKNMKLMAAIPMVASLVMPMTAFAATSYTDSVGSVAEDITNPVKVGQDTTQGEESTYSGEITKDVNNEACEVYLTKTSTFSVVIPKKVVVDGKAATNNVGDYTVRVKGDIAGNDVVTVQPDTSFYFKQAGKTDVLARVIQAKTTFQIGDNDVTEANIKTGVDALGQIKVDKITAGSWKGTFKFNIVLNTVAIEDEAPAPAGE